MSYINVAIVVIFIIIILLFSTLLLLLPIYFFHEKKSFIRWAERQYAVLINNNSDKASLLLTILSNDIKNPNKLSGLLDNEKVFDINSGEEENIVDIFKRPYSMPKYLLLRDESNNYGKEEVKKWIVNNYLHQTSDYNTHFFLITSYKGIFWKETKKRELVSSIKVLTPLFTKNVHFNIILALLLFKSL